ncbi:hypothetical protein ES708_01443 [subsurface metagenome]
MLGIAVMLVISILLVTIMVLGPAWFKSRTKR